jgi:hypothetical protein
MRLAALQALSRTTLRFGEVRANGILALPVFSSEIFFQNFSGAGFGQTRDEFE